MGLCFGRTIYFSEYLVHSCIEVIIGYEQGYASGRKGFASRKCLFIRKLTFLTS
jgi:hypothetical protein